MNIINKLFESLLQRYQEGLEEKMKGRDFVPDSVDLLYYHLHKISLKRGKSYVDSPKWLKNKKATINPKNNDDKCFQYAIIAALNHEKFKNHPERTSNLEPFIGEYELKNTDFPATSKDWKKFKQDNNTIALNILFVPYNTKQIRQAYKSDYSYKRYNQIILLMITDGEKWHYLALKSLSALLRGLTSNHNGDFYCLNCFRSYSTKNRLEKREADCFDHDYCYVKMPNEGNKTLKYNRREKSLKVPFTIFSHLEALLKKIHSCQNNPKKSYTEKKAKHTPSGYSLFTCCSFAAVKNKLDSYRGEDYMERFCKNLRDHAIKMINYKKKKMILLTDKENESYEKQKVCHICKKRI